jgi:hypothetical protein
MPIAIGPGGGPPGPSGSVSNVTSRDSIQVTAAGKVVDAATISATDGIYGIQFEFTVPKTSWQASIIQVSAADYASYIQQVAGHSFVSAAWYAPDTNKAGVLIDTLVVIVDSTSGLSDTQVEIPFSILNTPAAFQMIDNANVQLDAIEAIT